VLRWPRRPFKLNFNLINNWIPSLGSSISREILPSRETISSALGRLAVSSCQHSDTMTQTSSHRLFITSGLLSGVRGFVVKSNSAVFPANSCVKIKVSRRLAGQVKTDITFLVHETPIPKDITLLCATFSVPDNFRTHPRKNQTLKVVFQCQCGLRASYFWNAEICKFRMPVEK